jgi:hypothetical protein
LLPAATISTCLGIGFLPDWQRHWTAAFALAISGIIVYFLDGFRSDDYLVAAMPLTLFAIVFFILGLISVFLYRMRRTDIDDKLVIDAFVGQILIAALSVPATVEICRICMLLFKFLCDNIFYCAEWFYILMNGIFLFAIPYSVFRLFDIVNFWPGSWFVVVYNNTWARMSVGLSGAFYSIFMLYAVSFMLLDLSLLDVMQFFHGVFLGAVFNIDLWHKYGIGIYDYLANDALLNLIEKTGLRDMLENYGILEKLGIGTIETPGVDIESLDEVIKDIDEQQPQSLIVECYVRLILNYTFIRIIFYALSFVSLSSFCRSSAKSSCSSVSKYSASLAPFLVVFCDELSAGGSPTTGGGSCFVSLTPACC